jgi:hypothetical protein
VGQGHFLPGREKLRGVEELHARSDLEAAGTDDDDEPTNSGVCEPFDERTRRIYDDPRIAAGRPRPDRAHHDIVSGHRRSDARCVENISHYHGEPFFRMCKSGQIPDDGGHLVTARERLLGDGAAYRPACTEHGDFHG